MKLGPPEVHLSHEAVRVGEGLTVRYRQPFAKPVTVTRITLDWISRETATYRRGTDTVTVTHEERIDGAVFPSQSFAAGQAFEDERRFTVPLSGMHTFAATRNTLRWYVRLRVEIPGWPDLREEYEVRVLPEMVAGEAR